MLRMTMALLGVVTALSAAAPPQTPAAAPPPVVLVETAKGNFEIQFFPEDAPKSVEHILTLVKRSFYRGQRVHRVIAAAVQFGDIQSRDMSKIDYWGNGGSGSPIGVAEINRKRPHTRGAVSLAHSGNPAAADSQIFIVKVTTPEFNGKYAVIGRVIKGMDAVDRLEKTDILKNVSLKEAAPT